MTTMTIVHSNSSQNSLFVFLVIVGNATIIKSLIAIVIMAHVLYNHIVICKKALNISDLGG
jgi:hypothetical protein